MFTKYLIVVNCDFNIRDYRKLAKFIFENTDLSNDLIFSRGPLDVLDHSSDSFAFGGKLGIDATIKTPEEKVVTKIKDDEASVSDHFFDNLVSSGLITNYQSGLKNDNLPILILSVNNSVKSDNIYKLKNVLAGFSGSIQYKVIFIVDYKVDISDYLAVAWMVLGNSDPVRDHQYCGESSLIIDASIKAYRSEGFPRRWPNVVCSDNETIFRIDSIWKELGIGEFIASPSLKTLKMRHKGKEEIEK
jgi:4-hydroxy-3-polyprenylbenzoate decarboxylase